MYRHNTGSELLNFAFFEMSYCTSYSIYCNSISKYHENCTKACIIILISTKSVQVKCSCQLKSEFCIYCACINHCCLFWIFNNDYYCKYKGRINYCTQLLPKTVTYNLLIYCICTQLECTG